MKEIISQNNYKVIFFVDIVLKHYFSYMVKCAVL
jgi:hypothetical protein